MKQIRRIICLLSAFVLLAACGRNESGGADVDVDLSVLSGAVVYGKVYDMVNNGEKYEGQTVRMAGAMSEIPVREKDVVVDILHSCVIFDATGCCSQGIEFVLPEGGEYPPLGKEIVVEGVWNNYKLYGLDRYRLLDAKIR